MEGGLHRLVRCPGHGGLCLGRRRDATVCFLRPPSFLVYPFLEIKPYNQTGNPLFTQGYS